VARNNTATLRVFMVRSCRVECVRECVRLAM
jgi:hypothetical protein